MVVSVYICTWPYKDEPLFSKEVEDVQPVVLSQNSVLDYTEYVLPNGIRFVVKKTNPYRSTHRSR